jgi:maleate isomerase
VTRSAQPDATTGERLRVGLLVPSSNSVLEPEFAGQLPAWASLHPARLYVTDSNLDGLRSIHDAIPEAAALVGTVRPHLVVIGCTAVSGMDHGKFEESVVPQVAAATRAPVVTILASVIESLQRARCQRIVLVTPHGADIDAVLVEALAGAGIEVRETHSMGITDNFALGQVPVADIERFVVERLTRPLGEDGLFLSCANFRSAEALPGLRRRYGPRVVSSVQAVIDRTLAELHELRDDGSSQTAPPAPGGRGDARRST